jgi:hypothetical protein
MDKVIGLGNFGCLVSEELSQRPEYRVYKINSGITERGSLSLPSGHSLDEYEEVIDQAETEIYLRSIKPGDEVLFIVEGGAPISGASLSILECIKDAKITILYIAPDRVLCSEAQKRDDKIVFNILQQYARSGVFESMYLASKPAIEILVGDVPISEFQQATSYFISYVVAMINYFNHTDPYLSTKITPPIGCRIRSFGVSSLDETNRAVRLLFPLENITGIHFFYAVPTSQLESDNSLMKKIKEHVKMHQGDDLSSTFSVYSTTFDEMFVLCEASSPMIQTFAAD